MIRSTCDRCKKKMHKKGLRCDACKDKARY